MLQERLGLLNILNPNYVDRDFILRCEIYEDNKVGRLLVEYAVVEPGENWQNVTRQQNLMREPFPGWDLNVRFYPETLEKFDVPSELIVISGGKHGFGGDNAKIANAARLAWFEKYLLK